MAGLLNSHRFGVVAPLGDATWNPADKTGANLVLSSGDLQATSALGGVTQNVRATTFRNTGKFYFEGFIGLNAGFKFGLATTAWSLTDAAVGGVGAVHYSNLANIRSNGAVIHTDWSPAPAGAALVAVAVDLDANLIWFALNGGLWNGSGDPAAGTGGAAFADGSYTPSFSTGTLNQYVILNTGASAFAETPPSGYSAWND